MEKTSSIESDFEIRKNWSFYKAACKAPFFYFILDGFPSAFALDGKDRNPAVGFTERISNC